MVATTQVTVFAGTLGNPSILDGIGTTAKFNGPFDVKSDSSGNLYVAEYASNAVRKITPTG